MWCESKYPEMQKACKLLASEEMKHLECIAVIFMIMKAIFNLVRSPVKRAFNYIKKKVINTFKRKQPKPKVPQPCVLKVDTKVDIEKWILQARLYIEPLEEHKRKDMLMMLVDEPQRERLESNSIFDRAIHTDDHLFNVIRTMYKKKDGSPTENKKKFLKRTQRHDEPIADFAMEMIDTLYHAWPGLPRNQLEDLLIDYFINGLYNPETSPKLRIEGPTTLSKAIDIAKIYEELLNSNTNLINKTEYMTPQGYSLMETPTPSPPQISSGQPKIIKYMTQSAENFVTPTNIKSPQKSRTITLSALDIPNKREQKKILIAKQHSNTVYTRHGSGNLSNNRRSSEDPEHRNQAIQQVQNKSSDSRWQGSQRRFNNDNSSATIPSKHKFKQKSNDKYPR